MNRIERGVSRATVAVLSLCVASIALGASSTVGPGLPRAPGDEGPAGPPARLPNGKVASPPADTAYSTATCPPASYGAKFYAPGTGKTVALTFDDGPGPSTTQILSILKTSNVAGTFFNLGQSEAAYPDVVRDEAAGEAPGNHTWDHPDMTQLSQSQQAAEMDQMSAGHVALVGAPPCLFRPPYGNYNATTLALAQQRGMVVWLWSVDTEDWKANGSSDAYWVNRIISRAEAGVSLSHPVILMHNQSIANPATVLALPTIIRFYQDHGYTFVDLLGRTVGGDHFGSALASGDFNGDGFADLAAGVPLEDVSGQANAGAVSVHLGSAAGLTALGAQTWTQASPGIGGTAESGDQFGSALVSGDFNGDGYDDLAVAVAWEDLTVSDAGAIHIIYGSPSGLTGAGSLLWTQDSPGIAGSAESGDQFGWSLTAGDFDGDGFADLVAGVPFEDVGTLRDAGAAQVFYGAATGLSTRNQLWTQDSTGMGSTSEAGDRFGWALAAGDLDGSGQQDLAVGVPGEDLTVLSTKATVLDAGAFHVLDGTPSGLTGIGSLFWSQGTEGVAESNETGDQYGTALATGDLNGDGFADLTVGVPFEDVTGHLDAGSVSAFFGSGKGLTTTGNGAWTQDSTGIGDQVEIGDQFGGSVAIGDHNGDGFGDLSVAVRLEDVLGSGDAGAVNVISGSASGLSTAGGQFWTQDSPDIQGMVETGDQMGTVVGVGDVNADGRADLGIGDALEDIGTNVDAGGVNVIYGSTAGLVSEGNQFWS